ncbi:heterokaryon incompatibility protein-domain-containing protein [Camillea tinctor]|nr:heterokaryon incompatibility protein-domain-containing protein [Camillea tinctor]
MSFISNGPIFCFMEGTTMTVQIGPENNRSWRYINLFSRPDDPASRVGVSIRGHLMTTDSPYSLQIAQNWLSTCTTSHSCANAVPFLAGQYNSGSWPSRLLDLKALDEDIRLVDVEGPGISYAALSYCWGSDSTLHASYITISRSLETSRQRIGYSSLPRTLKDAVTVCRALGINYLWIDALCIIQDSESDWQAESVKMGSIYSQALVTIAAAVGDNCNAGCFNRRVGTVAPEIPVDTVEISAILGTGETSTLCFYREWRHEDFFFERAEEISSSLLQARAWTFQERLLSTRILHYGPEMLYWECRECYGDEQYLRTRHNKDETLPGFTVNHLETHFHPKTKEREIVTRWYRNIIEQYSRRALTYEEDKFPAISAVAQLVRHYTAAEYIAGVWSLNLQYGLFWKSVGTKIEHSSYVAPSFSWASCSNPVQWNEDPQVHMAEAEFTINGYAMEHKDDDPFGKLKSGWLSLTGHALKAKVQPYTMSFDEFSKLAYRRGLKEGDVVLPNAILLTESGDRCAHAYMDTVEADEEVLCFLLRYERSASDELCLLVISPISPTGNQYVRKGVAAAKSFPHGWADVYRSAPLVTVTLV